MQKQTIKRFSLLGLVLVAASAVTAAILPSTKSDAQPLFSLTAATRAGDDASTQSCGPTQELTNAACQDETVTGAVGATTGSTSAAVNTTVGTTAA